MPAYRVAFQVKSITFKKWLDSTCPTRDTVGEARTDLARMNKMVERGSTSYRKIRLQRYTMKEGWRDLDGPQGEEQGARTAKDRTPSG